MRQPPSREAVVFSALDLPTLVGCSQQHVEIDLGIDGLEYGVVVSGAVQCPYRSLRQ